MNLPIPLQSQAMATRNSLPAPSLNISAGRPKFLPTHWPVPEVRLRAPLRLTGPIESPAKRRWPGLVLKVLAVALCYALVRDAEAREPLTLRYGEPQVLSALGEPVDIRIPVTSSEVNPDARFVLGQQDATLGLPLLRNANIRLERDARGWSLRIQSTQRSTDPAMALVVQEVVSGGMVSRAMPVLFDPAPPRGPQLQVAEAEATPEPVRLGTRGDSWWTAAVVNKRTPAQDAPAATQQQVATAVAANAASNDKAVRTPTSTIATARESTARNAPATFIAQTPANIRNTPGKRNTTSPMMDTPYRASSTAHSIEAPRLRLAVALSDAPGTLTQARNPAVDRDALRWLQRGMLGSDDRAAMLALSRRVVQLTAQLDGLEQRLAEANLNGQATAQQRTADNSANPPAKAKPVTETTQALKLSAFMSDNPARKDGNPWGLPLLAGLMLGAGYWSGRRNRAESE